MSEFTLSNDSKSRMSRYSGSEVYFLQGVAVANTMIGHIERTFEGEVRHIDVYNALGAFACADGACGTWNCSVNTESFERRHNLTTVSGLEKDAFEEGVNASLTDYLTVERE